MAGFQPVTMKILTVESVPAGIVNILFDPISDHNRII